MIVSDYAIAIRGYAPRDGSPVIPCPTVDAVTAAFQDPRIASVLHGDPVVSADGEAVQVTFTAQGYPSRVQATLAPIVPGVIAWPRTLYLRTGIVPEEG